MKASVILSTVLLGFALAAPAPQAETEDLSEFDDSLPIDLYEATEDLPDLTAVIGAVDPAPISYDRTAAISDAVADALNTTDPAIEKRMAMEKRGNCQAAAPGNGPVASPDTTAGFTSFAPFAAAANAAVAPPGYFLVSGWKNLKASGQASSYTTFISSPLTSYNPAQCATFCTKKVGCTSFNIFYERDPVQNLDKTACPGGATGGPSLTRIKCSFFGAALTSAQATNFGGSGGGNFKTVIAGSNAYTTGPQPIPGFTGPVFVDKAVITVPAALKTYMGVQTFPQSQPFDPAVCAAACLEKTAYNQRHAVAGGPAPRVCRFFDAFQILKDGANPVFTCTYYTVGYGPAQATNFGQTRGGHSYTPDHSYLYTLA